MQRRTIILVLVFMVLLASVVFWQRSKQAADEAAEPTAPVLPAVFDFTQDQIDNMQLTGPQGKLLDLARNADRSWVLNYPPVAVTDSSAVEAALSSIITSRPVSILAEISGMADLGLQPAEYNIVMNLADGRQVVTAIGKKTPTGSGYYLLTSSGRKIFVVSSAAIEPLLAFFDAPPVLIAPESSPAP
jgi:hypothetical protein